MDAVKEFVEGKIEELKNKITDMGNLCPCGCQNDQYEWYQAQLKTYQEVLMFIESHSGSMSDM